MPMFKIFAGLGGSFGGAKYEGTYEFDNEGEAFDAAWEYACEIFASYEGLHGLPDFSEFLDEGLGDDEAEEAFNEARETWLVYYAEQVDE